MSAARVFAARAEAAFLLQQRRDLHSKASSSGSLRGCEVCLLSCFVALMQHVGEQNLDDFLQQLKLKGKMAFRRLLQES